VARIQLVRPQRASQISNMIIKMAQSGQIRGRVSEDQREFLADCFRRSHVRAVISVLDQVEAMEKGSAAGKQESKITVRCSTRKIAVH
jgi:programmed cell death protein 5